MKVVTVARKPLSESSVALNVLEHGTGGINVDASRVGTSGARNNGRKAGTNGIYGVIGSTVPVDYGKGRWPANLILDVSPEIGEALPDTGPPCGGVKKTIHKAGMFGIEQPGSVYTQQDGDNNSAARYFKTIPMGEDTP